MRRESIDIMGSILVSLASSITSLKVSVLTHWEKESHFSIVFCSGWTSGVIKLVCKPAHTHTNPRGRLKWPSAITRLTAHCTCGLMSDLVICRHKKVWLYVTPNILIKTRCKLNNTNSNFVAASWLTNTSSKKPSVKEWRACALDMAFYCSVQFT